MTSLSFLILLVLIFSGGDAAPVNVNVKSGFLSRLVGNNSHSPPKRNKHQSLNEPSPNTPTLSGASPEEAQTTKKGKVSLDLSGTYHVLVAGPTAVPSSDTTTMQGPVPLVSTGTTETGWSLTCSMGYNFSQAWYGATRLLTRLSWSHHFRTEPTNPLTVHVQAEKGLSETNDYAGQVGLSLVPMSSTSRYPPSIHLRWEPNVGNQVTVAAPLLHRVGLVWKSLFPTLHSSTPNVLQDSIPTTNSLDWWIPNLKISTAGRLTADNQVGFDIPRFKQRKRLGIRLVLSRHVGWSAFGGQEFPIQDLHDEGTLMKLKVTTADDVSCSSLEMTSILERPIDSTLLILSHEQVHFPK